MTPDAWVERHPYLRDLARFSSRVETAAAQIPAPKLPIPGWDAQADESRAGVPLLQSSAAPIDFEPAGSMAVALVRSLAADGLEGRPGEDVRDLDRQIRDSASMPGRIAGWLLGDDAWSPASPGLLRYLGWISAARYLAPVVSACSARADGETWMRAYCPVCGSPPSMAQLAGRDPGRRRLLACGRCRARWPFSRTACPFCDTDSQRLSSVTVQGEAGLRIDHCGACRGYLKTYDGEGNETLFLADWTSLHLDLIAVDRSFRRVAASLYELPAASPVAP